MTELEYIEIEGFKGLKHVEFEPTDINLITGRNNTGKTSLLEAIGIAFNPKYIQKFGENIDSIVNEDSSISVIHFETTDSSEVSQLRRPTDDEANQYFADIVGDIFRSLPFFKFEWKDEELRKKLVKKIDNLAQMVYTAEEYLTTRGSIKNEFLVLVLDNTQYPYFSAGQRTRELISSVGQKFMDELKDEYDTREILSKSPKEFRMQTEPSEWTQNPSFSQYALFQRIQEKEGFLTRPKNTEAIKFIESIELSGDIQKDDEGKAAIKIDDIGDFIKKRKFVDNLKTFDIDYLVFEKEDDEKYQVPYEFMGDGFKSIVGLLWELLDDSNENNIILIEEPETHMHPGYVAELVHFLIDLARDEDIQFFITTHDHDFIKDFFMDMPDEKREYLEDEFSLVKMDDFGADVMEYEEAEHHLKDLHLDLRGI